MKKRTESIWIIVCACGIAVVLLALLLPPVPGCHRNRPRRMKAQVELSWICAALEAYFHEYGAVPDFDGETGPGFVRILSGDNPREIMFMEFDPDDKTTGFHDPWSTRYRVSVTQGHEMLTICASSFGKNRSDDNGEEDDLVQTRSIQHQPGG